MGNAASCIREEYVDGRRSHVMAIDRMLVNDEHVASSFDLTLNAQETQQGPASQLNVSAVTSVTSRGAGDDAGVGVKREVHGGMSGHTRACGMRCVSMCVRRNLIWHSDVMPCE